MSLLSRSHILVAVKRESTPWSRSWKGFLNGIAPPDALSVAMNKKSVEPHSPSIWVMPCCIRLKSTMHDRITSHSFYCLLSSELVFWKNNRLRFVFDSVTTGESFLHALYLVDQNDVSIFYKSCDMRIAYSGLCPSSRRDSRLLIILWSWFLGRAYLRKRFVHILCWRSATLSLST